jgi:AGZA family xanthine/uracil permease-like MFS transporter
VQARSSAARHRYFGVLGFIACVVLRSAAGKAREVGPLLWVVAAGFVLYFARSWIESLIGL